MFKAAEIIKRKKELKDMRTEKKRKIYYKNRETVPLKIVKKDNETTTNFNISQLEKLLHLYKVPKSQMDLLNDLNKMERDTEKM